jgi:hypothetical protein
MDAIERHRLQWKNFVEIYDISRLHGTNNNGMQLYRVRFKSVIII